MQAIRKTPMKILEIFTECLAEVLDSSANAVGTSVGRYLRLLRRYRKIRSPSSEFPTLLHTSRDLLIHLGPDSMRDAL